MNKYQEAKKFINEILQNPNWSIVGINWQATDEIKELLDKETPMKTLCRGLQYQTNGKPIVIGFCPTCASFTGSKDIFCSQCGQRLDWSDNND